MTVLGGTETLNVVDLLRNDHIAAKALFSEFASAEDDAQRRRIAEKAIRELIQHAGSEEEVFYPAIRKARPSAETAELLDEANEEHHVAKVLIRELQGMRTVDNRYRAKFTVLSELIKHHAAEEESEIFPLARTSGLDLEALGRSLLAAKGHALEQWEERWRELERGRNGGQPKPAGKRTAAKRRRGARRSR
jgi:hemerythrin superfamily protein